MSWYTHLALCIGENGSRIFQLDIRDRTHRLVIPIIRLRRARPSIMRIGAIPRRPRSLTSLTRATRALFVELERWLRGSHCRIHDVVVVVVMDYCETVEVEVGKF